MIFSSTVVSIFNVFYCIIKNLYASIPKTHAVSNMMIPYISLVATFLRKYNVDSTSDIENLKGYRSIEEVEFLDPKTKKMDIFIFGNIAWEYRQQRAQNISIELSKLGYRVFYISSEFVNTSEPSVFIKQGGRANLIVCKISAFGKPLIYFYPPSKKIAKQQLASCKQLYDRLSYSSSAELVALIQHPYWYGILQGSFLKNIVYDCMDYHAGFGNAKRSITKLEDSLVRNASLVVTTSSELQKLLNGKAKRIITIKNATEFSHFAKVDTEHKSYVLHKPILGYYGAISEWLDIDLIEFVATTLPDCHCILVGQDSINAQKRLSSLTNVSFTGEVIYDDLPDLLHNFDVCLLPFKINKLTECTNPIKVYEYLSAGKPVVSVDLPEMEQFEELVYVAKNYKAFVDKIQRALLEKGDNKLVEQRISFARHQSWENRARDLELAILKFFS